MLPHPVSRFLSAAGFRFSAIRFPPRDWALLTVGLTGPKPGPRRGYPRFARTSYSRGGCLLYPEEVRSSPVERSPQPAPAASQRRQSLHPATQHPSAGPSLPGINGGSSNSPVPGSSPRPVTPDGTGVLGLPPQLRTPPDQEPDGRTSGWGTGHEHGPGATYSTSVEPPIYVFARQRATSRRNRAGGQDPAAGGGGGAERHLRGGFLGFSYGFRPGRSPHDALDALAVGIDVTR